MVSDKKPMPVPVPTQEHPEGTSTESKHEQNNLPADNRPEAVLLQRIKLLASAAPVLHPTQYPVKNTDNRIVQTKPLAVSDVFDEQLRLTVTKIIYRKFGMSQDSKFPEADCKDIFTQLQAIPALNSISTKPTSSQTDFANSAPMTSVTHDLLAGNDLLTIILPYVQINNASWEKYHGQYSNSKLDNVPGRETRIEFGPLHAKSQQGTKVTALIAPDHPLGTAPQEGNAKTLAKDASTKAKPYKAGHLLNGKLGGPGTDENLTAIPGDVNSTHATAIESQAEKSVNVLGKTIYYDVTVKYPPGADYASELKVIYAEYPDPATADIQIPPDQNRKKVVLDIQPPTHVKQGNPGLKGMKTGVKNVADIKSNPPDPMTHLILKDELSIKANLIGYAYHKLKENSEQAKIKDLNTKISALQNALTDKTSEIDLLKQELAAAEKKHKQTEDALLELENQIIDLETELNKVETENIELKKEVATLKSEINGTLLQVDDYRRTIAESEQKINELRSGRTLALDLLIRENPGTAKTVISQVPFTPDAKNNFLKQAEERAVSEELEKKEILARIRESKIDTTIKIEMLSSLAFKNSLADMRTLRSQLDKLEHPGSEKLESKKPEMEDVDTTASKGVARVLFDSEDNSEKPVKVEKQKTETHTTEPARLPGISTVSTPTISAAESKQNDLTREIETIKDGIPDKNKRRNKVLALLKKIFPPDLITQRVAAALLKLLGFQSNLFYLYNNDEQEVKKAESLLNSLS